MEKNKAGMITIIVILIVMFLVFALTFIYTISLLNKTKAAVETGQQTAPAKEAIVEYNVEELSLHELKDSVTVNLASSSSDTKEHIVVVKVVIGLNQGGKKDKDAKKEFEKISLLLTEKEVIATDSIIKILRNKTFDEIKKPDSQSIISEEILNTLQELFNTNAIVSVMFGSFNYQ